MKKIILALIVLVLTIGCPEMKMEKCETPTITYDSLNFVGSQSIILSCDTVDAIINYTLNGETPNSTIGTTYTGEFTIESSCTIKVVAYKEGFESSDIIELIFTKNVGNPTINPGIATPIINPNGGPFIVSQEIAITCATSGVTIFYTLDETTPTSESLLYNTEFTITEDTTIKAIAYNLNLETSYVVNETFARAEKVLLTISPDGGSFIGSQEVILSTSITDATIYYTLDGSTPTSNSSQYSSAFTIDSSCTIKAIAYKTGLETSDVGTKVFTGKVATPTVSPDGGSFIGSQELTLSCSTTDVTIYYTSDGTTPTSSSTVYSSAFTIDSNCTIKAVAYKTGLETSDVVTSNFEIVSASKPVPEVQLSQTTGNYLYQRITMDARASIINRIDDEDTVNWSGTSLETVKYSSMSDDNGVVVTGDEAIQFDERVSTDELFTEELPIYLPRTAGIYAVKFTLANTNGDKSTTTYSVKMAVEANEEYPMPPDNSTVLYSNNNITSVYGSSVNDITDDSLTEYGDLFIDPDVANSTLGDAVSTLKKGTIVITFKSDSSQTSWGSLFSVRTSNTSYWAMVLKGSQVCAEVAPGELSPKKTIDADSENPISYTYIVRYDPDRVASPYEDDGVYSFFGNNFGENHWDPSATYDQFFMNSTTSTSDLKVQFGNCDRSNPYLLEDGIEIESFKLYSDVASDEWCRSVTVKPL